MNEYDSKRIYDITEKNNYSKTKILSEADCYVLNTCHIREKATEKVYHNIGRVKKEFRNKKKPIVIITGCVAQAEGEILLEKEKYIDAVIGPQSYHLLNETLKEIENKSKRVNSTEFEVIEKFDNLNVIKNSCSDVSSFLTIQEGCDKFCKFCVVPYTRGTEYSRSITEILNECKVLVKNGVREITLLGQNVNAYNYQEKKLPYLIEALSKINDLKRIRYTTSHPKDFSDDLIEIHRTSSKLMPLIHLPVQSGSSKILKDMNRKHSIEYYLDLIFKIKKANPLIKFSSDFIIGYPGESKKDFEATLKLLEKVNYINCFSFIFSPRPGTPASSLKQINVEVAKERLSIFQKKAEEVKLKYRKNLFNNKSKVLFENRSKKNKNYYFGRDEFLNSVIVKSDQDLEGEIKEVIITGGNLNTLFGELSTKGKEKVYAA